MKRGETKPPIHRCPECGATYRYDLPFQKHLWDHDRSDHFTERARSRLHDLGFGLRLSPFRLFVDDGAGALEHFYTVNHDRREVWLSWAVPATRRGLIVLAAACDIEAAILRAGVPRRTPPKLLAINQQLYVVRYVPSSTIGEGTLAAIDHVVRQVFVNWDVPNKQVESVISRALRA